MSSFAAVVVWMLVSGCGHRESGDEPSAGTAHTHEVRRLRATAEEVELATTDLEREVEIALGIADAAVETGAQSWALAQDARRLAELEVTLAEDRFDAWQARGRLTELASR